MSLLVASALFAGSCAALLVAWLAYYKQTRR